MLKDIKLVGFRYSKIGVERVEDPVGELKITPNINIKSIEEHKSKTAKQDVLQVDFQFKIDYSSLGKVELEGKLYLSVDKKMLKDTIDEWKSKKLSKDINLIILNIIMQKASIKALELEEEMNLPPHIQLPRLQLDKKE